MYVIEYSDAGVTISELRRVLRALRWAELEAMAYALEELRRGGAKESKRRLTGAHISAWANEPPPKTKGAK